MQIPTGHLTLPLQGREGTRSIVPRAPHVDMPPTVASRYSETVFPHQVTVQWSEADAAYVARVPAVGATATGTTPDKAVRAAVKAAAGLAVYGDVQPEKNAAAVALGRAGGIKGGAARAASLSKARRAEIAKKAAAARWGK